MPKKYQSFSDKFGDGEFYPDTPKVAFSELINHQFLLLDAKILKDFNSQYGKHDAALLLLAPADDPEQIETDSQFTTICSGSVVVERVNQALSRKMLPLLCTPVFVDDKYYNLL